MYTANTFTVGTRATFTYHDKLRVGEVVVVGDTFIKVKHDDGVTKSYSFEKMSDPR